MPTRCEKLARLDRKYRPLLVKILPPWLSVAAYSYGRKVFLKTLEKDTCTPISIDPHLSRTLWGIKFRSPVLNAAGMFKGSDGYSIMSAQGAGAFLAGSYSYNSRAGNFKKLIQHPFVPYPKSKAASNWMGLPNHGVVDIALMLKELKKVDGCPFGASIVPTDSSSSENDKALDILRSMELLTDAGADFFEINISCPNTGENHNLIEKNQELLQIISQRFIQRDSIRYVPVIVKMAHDISFSQLERFLEFVIAQRFAGLNIANTSTDYDKYRADISPDEQKLFGYFSKTFGGGLSGKPLKAKSLSLLKCASAYIQAQRPWHEFHLIRTGGIENAADVEESLKAGASLVQWFSGYFEGFASKGHQVYQELYQHLTPDR